MKVLVNSDIAFSQKLRSDLPKELVPLAEVCKERNHEIALPHTSVLEFERKQREVAESERLALRAAAGLLDTYGIRHDEISEEDLPKTRSLDDLFRDAGVKVEVIEPTHEDFKDAHRRASLHLPPQKPNQKGGGKGQDEMRDLVIWAIAVRTAREQGGALLVSRDEIHSGQLGKQEAVEANLTVVASVDDALKYFKVETPDAMQFIAMLTPVWAELPGRGVDVGADVVVSDVRRARFVEGAGDHVSAVATVHVRLKDGAEKALLIKLDKEADHTKLVEVSDPSDETIELTAVPSVPDPAEEEGRRRLRRLIGG